MNNINANEKQSQSQTKAICSYLESGNALTGLEAITLFGCIRLASRISDLRSSGHPIADRWITTASGKRVKQYYIA